MTTEPKTYRSKVLRIFEECESVRTFRFEIPADFSFVPGMYLKVSLPEFPGVEKALSISSSPGDEGYVEVTCRRVASSTGRIFSMAVGDAATLKGPFGKWLYEDSQAGTVLIGGGVGIAPLRSMARYELGRGRPEKVSFFYSARTPSDIVFRGELQRFAKAGMQVKVTITRPEAMKAGESWEGGIGRLDPTRILSEVPDSRECVFYLCGPSKMISDLSAGLAAQGVARERIRTESWGTPD